MKEEKETKKVVLTEQLQNSCWSYGCSSCHVIAYYQTNERKPFSTLHNKQVKANPKTKTENAGKCIKVKVKLSLCFNWTPFHEGILGEWRCNSTMCWLVEENTVFITVEFLC